MVCILFLLDNMALKTVFQRNGSEVENLGLMDEIDLE